MRIRMRIRRDQKRKICEPGVSSTMAFPRGRSRSIDISEATVLHTSLRVIDLRIDRKAIHCRTMGRVCLSVPNHTKNKRSSEHENEPASTDTPFACANNSSPLLYGHPEKRTIDCDSSSPWRSWECTSSGTPIVRCRLLMPKALTQHLVTPPHKPQNALT
ncbi:uncharacterized protein M421DRAFT_351125 [Didymella exigua CBS 183.55]|uniref:Uncharacterized protein n=1 Tax=Didymella exigua CBS 183.55 TaxID=1150837 RepID=A0A6A5R696_9PLEO|nr:uncharacterized protein M421DRAFT_351125 [Didymella exigua CBS 183.55]KAF1922708.1 hypothetical protein M421DRAFT_351125 [Didymella exigua CBS 183.55]